MDKYIIIYHKDWSGKCLIKDNIIYRENVLNNDGKEESGTIEYINDKLIINWNNWEKEKFIYLYKNLYIENEYYEDLNVIYLISKKTKYILLVNDYNIILNYENIIYDENNIKFKNNEYYQFIDNIYILYKNFNKFFYIQTINFGIKKTFILNKDDNTFFEKNNIKNEGKYIIDNNTLKLKWEDNSEKNFLSNIYYECNTLNYENIKIIKPINFMIKNRVLFSNITLIKNKILLTSLYYKKNPWKLDNIKFNIHNNKIIKKNIIEYKNYESCVKIILELEKSCNIIELEILYEECSKNIILNELILPRNDIYSMTLFKNDYQLLKKYLEYYSNLGIECFILYYNEKITDDFVNEINIINQSKFKIILIEWDYEYWCYYNEKEKHHHSQVMAINDSLYILKNYCNYILFNDLDEYIKLESSEYNNFKELINKYSEIDIFEFKCMFSKMGDKLIKYRNFYFEYDENKIIKGNFWDKFREKNLIKTKSIDLMGVHEPAYEHCSKDLKKKYISHFFHFINFYEKNRLELMTQYIS